MQQNTLFMEVSLECKSSNRKARSLSLFLDKIVWISVSDGLVIFAFIGFIAEQSKELFLFNKSLY